MEAKALSKQSPTETYISNPSPFLHPYASLLNQSQPLKLQKSQIKQILRLLLSFSAYSSSRYKPFLKLNDKLTRNFRWLTNLTFGVSSFPPLTSNQMIHTIKFLQRIQSLTHLKLTGDILSEVPLIAPFLKKLKRIQHLQLNPSCFELSQSVHLSRFFSVFRRLNKLQGLKIQFDATPRIRAQAIKALCAGLSLLKTIKTFEFDLTVSTLDPDVVKDFSFDFGVSKSLSEIIFKFRNTKGMNDQALVKISQSLKNVKNLQKLELILTGCFEITTKGITIFLSNLPPRLKSLKLDLTNCNQILPPGFQSFFSAIVKLSFLTQLSLKFCLLNKMDDDGLKDLTRCLNNLKFLNHLFVSFSWCNLTFTEPGLGKFLTQLAGKSALKSLVLHFPNCSNVITDSNLIKLGEALACMKDLETFGLDISGCSNVTDKGINGVFKKIGRGGGFVEKLERISLNLIGCGKVEVNAIENLMEVLKKLKELRYLVLQLKSSKNLKREDVRKILPSPESVKFKLNISYR